MTENQALQGVRIDINGEQFTLAFTLYAFAKLKKVSNLNALKGEIDFMDPDHLLYFLWAGLISNHPEFDGEMVGGRPDKHLSGALRKLGTFLTLAKMNDLGASIKEAFTHATKTTSDEDEEPKGKKR